MFEMAFNYQSDMFHHVLDILGLKKETPDNFEKFL